MTAAGVEVVARGASVRGRRGPVFEDVDVDVPAGGLLAAHGPAGSGRTSLLLALAGRMRLSGGAEVMAERCLTSPGVTERGIREAFTTLDVAPRGADLVEDLGPADRLLLATALALAERPGALVVDDVDEGCHPMRRDPCGRPCNGSGATAPPCWPAAFIRPRPPPAWSRCYCRDAARTASRPRRPLSGRTPTHESRQAGAA